MAEALSADLQATINAILASIQSVRDENKQLRHDSKNQNRVIHEENKKILAAVHEQAKQNKNIVEAAEKKITEKVESIRVDFEAALEVNNSRITECETRMLSVEDRMQSQTTAINDFINSHENKLEILEQQMKKYGKLLHPQSRLLM